MFKVITLLFFFSLNSSSQVQLGIGVLDKQIKSFSVLQIYTNKLFKNIRKSAHLNEKGKKFFENQLMGFQKKNLDTQRIKIDSIIKTYKSLNKSQKEILSDYYKNVDVKKLIKKRSHPLYDKKFENFLMKINLNKVSRKKLIAIADYTQYSNSHSEEFNLELAKLKNLYLLKNLSTKKIRKLSFYVKDTKLSKIIALSADSRSFSKEVYATINSRLKRIQKKSVNRQIASMR